MTFEEHRKDGASIHFNFRQEREMMKLATEPINVDVDGVYGK